MAAQGLTINTTGCLAFLRYLWSLPIVRKLAGWVLQWILTRLFEWLRKRKPKEKQPVIA